VGGSGVASAGSAVGIDVSVDIASVVGMVAGVTVLHALMANKSASIIPIQVSLCCVFIGFL
jgi:hypothetical protein